VDIVPLYAALVDIIKVGSMAHATEASTSNGRALAISTWHLSYGS
jgi:hypothetical protein